MDEGWAGGIAAQYGVAPRVRIGKSKWFNLLWLIPIGFLLLVIGIAVAKGIRELPAVQDFIARYPGESELPEDAPVGLPAWLGWQHFLNLFLMIFIIRSGITIIADHPRFYWTRHSTPGKEWFRDPEPGAAGPAVHSEGRTRSPCPTVSGCRVVATRSAWLGGGTWVSTPCGC